MNVCAALSIQAGGADQNDSTDILETYTDSTSLSGWVGEAGMVEWEVLSFHIEALHWFAFSCHVASKNL